MAKKKKKTQQPKINKQLQKKVNANLDMFIYSHKPFSPMLENKAYKILTCSKEEYGWDTNLPVYGDYEDDNISDMNLMYNEYTGFYWIWKNWPLKDYVGLNHYRRMYSWIDEIPDMDIIFENFDIVLNRPIYFEEAIDGARDCKDNLEWYKWWHCNDGRDFTAMEELVNEKYPEYKVGFERMKNANYLYNSSMFIMKKDMFKEYCEFIFKFLQDYRDKRGFNTVDDCINYVTENQDAYIKPHLPYYTVSMQARIVGYIAERAMNMWLMNGDDPIEKHAAVVDWIMVDWDKIRREQND